MARKQAGDIVRSKDRYKQVRVVREEEVAKKVVEWQPRRKPNLDIGDICTTTLRPLFFSIKRPIIILDIQPDKGFSFDWKVLVDTTDGKKWLGASLFCKLKP